MASAVRYATVVENLKELVQLRDSKEMDEEEFTNAKRLVLGGVPLGADDDACWKETANATNRPMEKGQRYRRRSVKDWLKRALQDIGNQGKAEDTDPREAKMLALVGANGVAMAPDETSGSISIENVRKALDTYWTKDAYQEWAGPGFEGGSIYGRYLVAGDDLPKLMQFFCDNVEWHFDFAKAKYTVFNNELIMDLGWYKAISKKGDAEGDARKSYPMRAKVKIFFNEDTTKLTGQTCYFENTEDAEGFVQLQSDDDFKGILTSKGIKIGGDEPAGLKVTTYPTDTKEAADS